jgi:hypothetical protein
VGATENQAFFVDLFFEVDALVGQSAAKPVEGRRIPHKNTAFIAGEADSKIGDGDFKLFFRGVVDEAAVLSVSNISQIDLGF